MSLPKAVKGCAVFKDERVLFGGHCETWPFGYVSVEETEEFERTISLAGLVFVLAAMKIAFAGVASKPD
jgi:hypothetical protein